MITLTKIIVTIASLFECLGIISFLFSILVGFFAGLWWLLSLGGVAMWVAIGILTSMTSFVLHDVVMEWQYRRRKDEYDKLS